MLKLKNQLQTGGVFILGVAGHHYISKILDYRKEMESSKEAEMKAVADQQNMEVIHNKLNERHNCTFTYNIQKDEVFDKSLSVSINRT